MGLISVVIVDDHNIVREGVRMILENDDQIEVVGDASNIPDALELISEAQPDIILLDVNLDGASSLDQMEVITEACPTSRILVLTGIVNEETNKRAADGGAQGLILKSQASAVLLNAIKKVHGGEIWFDRTFTSRLLADARKRSSEALDNERLINTLTPREREIVMLIAEGLVNKDIAQRLSINEKTVRNALTVIYQKVMVTNRLELALFASRHGLSS